MGKENNFYLAPWVKEYKEKEKARQTWLLQLAEKYALSVEDSKHPNGHYMNEVIVTPLGTSLGTVSFNAMLDNLLSSTRERQAKDRRDASNMIRHIHEGTDTAAKALYPLVAAPAVSALPGAIAASGITKSLAPGSAFWMHPITRQMLTGTAMSEGVNLVNKAVSGYNTVGEGVGNLVEQATGWNPNNTWLGPLVTEAVNPGWYVSPNGVMNTVGRVTNTVENIPNFVGTTADKLGFFIQKPGTYTRGIGITDAGLKDAIETGVIRGNPRGTELTAKQFTKGYERNRDHFRDIMNATGIKDIASKFQSRTLSEEEFNAIKEASKNYTIQRLALKGDTFTPKEFPADPLYEYSNYEDYVQSVRKTIADVEKMPTKVASGEVLVNSELTSTTDGIPHGRPIIERFGPNSDYVGDGHPLSYWYDDGRNPITRGHSYAHSNYGIRVNNPEDYQPFMHEMHLHPSFFKTPRLSDPNVEVFKKGLFGITRRVNKEKLLRQHIPTITSENAASITPEQWTAAQDAAIARGDMAEAQRLRDLHFKVSAPNTKVKEAVFNGSLSDKPFYEFNTNFRDAYWGGRDDYTTGAWFGTGDKNTLLSFAGDNPNRLKKFYLNFSNPFIKDAGYRRWNKLLPFNMTEEDIAIEAAKLREKGFPEYVIEDWKKGLKTTTDNYALKLETTDYDSGIIKNVYENKAHPDSEYGVITDYIASKPNQIKLADAVTYDDNGVRIPLGKRDNFKLNDIRYSWLLPFLAVGAASYKQGGKMNILQFLKSGSGIHIKKENKGLFTDYCKGKVTSECIAKGKRSSNPTIRKRATFAANARKWKHEDGGRVKKHLAFVNGVSILDSNPDAYKYVKKKIKKAAEGDNSKNWFSKAGAWINKNLDTISNIAGTAMNGISSIVGSILKLKSANDLIKANNLKDLVSYEELMAKYLQEEMERLQKEEGQYPGINSSPIVNNYVAYLRALQKALAEMANLKNLTAEENAKIQQEAQSDLTNSIIGTVGNLANTGIGLLANKFNNKTQTTPSIPTYKPYKYDMTAPFRKDFTLKV